jgi:Ser/Thr protein kinase RdoA (MazF antagonist)
VDYEGRFGIVLPRLDGPTLLQRLQSRATSLEQGGAILADLYRSVHATPPPPDVPSLRDWVAAVSRSPDAMPKHIVGGVLALVERLPPSDALCHGDLHTSNVIMTADGPKIIDWLGAVRAPASHDLVRLHIMLTELVPDGVDPEPPGVLSAAVQAAYARLTGVSPAALAAAMLPGFPILRATALADRTWTRVQRAQLIQRVEATLRLENLI